MCCCSVRFHIDLCHALLFTLGRPDKNHCYISQPKSRVVEFSDTFDFAPCCQEVIRMSWKTSVPWGKKTTTKQTSKQTTTLLSVNVREITTPTLLATQSWKGEIVSGARLGNTLPSGKAQHFLGNVLLFLFFTISKFLLVLNPCSKAPTWDWTSITHSWVPCIWNWSLRQHHFKF